MEDDKEILKERKLNIARKLLESVEFPKVKGHARARAQAEPTQKELRLQRTLQLITNPAHQNLYSLTLERKLMTDSGLNDMINQLEAIARRHSHSRVLVLALRESLKRSLFGCEVNVALCTDASSTQLEFISDNGGYVRKATRGQSTCFECLDQRDVVLQMVTKSKNETDSISPHITVGDAVVYVPLIGTGGGVGVVEIHGLQSENVSDRNAYERPLGALKAMIHAKDYRFKETVKLWRIPSARSGGTIINECKASGVTMYHVVCGVITTVAAEKHGVPYVGGARYTIEWEDGLVEEAVSASELLKVYANTPQSLGCGTTLDEHLVESFLNLGLKVGEMLELQRTRDVVITLRKKLFQPDLQDTDVCEITLDAIGNVITGIRVSHLLAFNPMKNEAVSLMIKFPSARTVDRALKNTFSAIVRECMQSANPTMPTVVDDIFGLEWVIVEVPVPAGYSWPKESQLTRFFCAIIRYKNPQQAAGMAEIRYFLEMVAALSEVLAVLFKKLLRAKHRKDLIKSIEDQLYEWRHLSVAQICHNAIQVASEILPPPTSIYVGVLQPAGNILKFIASNSCSEMVGKILHRGKGISFETMELSNAVVLRDADVDKKKVLVPNAIVDVQYGKVYYRAKILTARGHDMYDVLYDEDQVTETAVNIDRIRPVSSAFRTHKFGPVELPFVSVPLRYRTKSVGVLNVDNFRNVPKAPFDPQPEEGIINFLDKLGRILGTTIDTQSKKASLRAFATVCRSQSSSLNEIMETLFECLSSNLFYLTSIIACQVPTEDPLAAETKAVTPKETAIVKGGVKIPAAASKRAKAASKVKSFQGITIMKAVNVILTQGIVPTEVRSALNMYDPDKFHLKPVHPKGDKCVWLVCKLRTPDKSIPPKIFLVAINQRLPFNDPDIEYLQIIQKILIEGLQGLDVRKARGEIRFEALREIKQICLKWPSMDRHDLFAAVMEQVEMCFFSANVYVGKIGMFNQEIRYFLASRLSNMKGQLLKRSMKDGISFTAVDEMKRIFCQQKSSLAHSLHHFGPREQFEYPFVVIPIVAHIDAAIAILGVDSCDDPISDSERHENIISFFGTVASQLSTALKGYLAQDARSELSRISLMAKNFKEGMREVKKCLLTYLPFASRVAEVLYVPRELASFRGDLIAHTLDEYIVHIRIMALESLSKTQPAVTLECYWNGVSAFKSKFKTDSDCLPFSIHIAKGVPLNHVTLQCVIRGANGKDICRKSLGFHYFVNAPVYAIDHLFDNTSSTNFKDVHIAKVTMVSKMYRYEECVYFTITNLAGIELNAVDDHKLPDPVARVFWNGTELARTPAKENTRNPTWDDQNIVVCLDSKIAGTGVLSIELWDEDILGRSSFFGRVEVTDTKLNDMAVSDDLHKDAHFISEKHSIQATNHHRPSKAGSEKISSVVKERKSTIIKPKRTTFIESIHEVVEHHDEGLVWLPLGKHPTLPSYMQNLVAGSLSFKGFTTKAHQMNTKQVLDMLNVNIVETVTTTVLDSESAGHSAQAEFFSSELRVLSAKDLILKETYSGIPEPLLNAFVIVSFNGEEVGRTGTVLRSENPSWDDEKFTIRCPSRDPGASILHLEVFHLGEHGKALLIGKVTITGPQLISLLAGAVLRSWWFDLHPRDGVSLEHTFFRGQLKLAGHPLKIDVAGQDVDSRVMPSFEISILGGKNILLKEKLSRYVVTATFNGILILLSQAYSETGEVKWNNEKVVFWESGNIPLEKSELLIEFWPLDRQGSRLEKRLAVAHIGGITLNQLFKRTGCVSTWIPVIHVAEAATSKKIGTHSTQLSAISECLIRTGPQGGADEILTDGRELFVHVMAASMLSARPGSNRHSNQGMVKANPYCLIKWNGRLIGQTTVLENSIDPIWSKQRFCFQAPRQHGDDDTVSQCNLRIEIFDRNEQATKVDGDRPLGCVILTGKALSSFINSGVIKTKWIPLIRENVSAYQEKMDRASATSQRAIYGELKLRAGAIGDAEDDSNDLSPEYRVDILSAIGLGQSDAFKKSNPYAVVEWGKKERGRTKVCNNTNSPEFHQESFLLRIPSERKIHDQLLTISLWSYRERYQDDFLGCVSFTGDKLVEFLSHSSIENQLFALEKSPELTDDENALAQGVITLRGCLVQPEIKLSSIYTEALLSIIRAKDLSKCNLFGCCIDSYCVVYWSSLIENGGDERELFRTQTVSNSVDPEFQDESVIVNVPIDEDWSSVVVRIEVWDIGNDFLGGLSLSGDSLKELLGRRGRDTVEPITYYLSENPSLPKLKQQLVKGQLVLCGGEKSDCEEQLAILAKAAAEEANARNTFSVKGFDESGSTAKIIINSCKKLGKGDGLLGKSNPFCKVRWNKAPLANSETIYSTLNPHWDNAVYSVKLPLENNLERCLLEIEVWHANALGKEVADFLGMVSLRGSMLGAIFASQGKKEIEFALRENSSLNARQNKLVSANASIALSGIIDEASREVETGSKETTAPKHLELIKFEVNVMAASELANTNSFGRPPDSFVCLYWRDQDVPIAKTLVVPGKTNPTFAETFILEKPEGVSLDTLTLRLAVYGKNTVKENDFLGEIIFSGELLENWICHNDGRLTTFDLQKNAILPEKKQTFVKGSLTIGTRSLSSESQLQEKIIPPGMKEMEISVLAASNLPKANMFGGMSDPYCVITWGATEIGKTSTITETCDPIWDGDESFQFFAPVELGAPKDGKFFKREKDPALAAVQSARSTLLSSAKGREEELRLAIDVFDWNRVGKGVFLGSVEIKGKELHEFASGSRMKRQWFDLGPSTRLPADQQKLVKADNYSRIELMFGPFEESVDGRDIELTIVEATGLAKVDTFGFADPYVKIRFNNRFIGKTDVVKRTLNPEWDSEEFIIRLPATVEFVDSVLYLEVWDWNLTAKGTFLGCVKLSGHALKRFVEESHFSVTWFELTKSEYLPESMQGYVQGKIALKGGLTGDHEQIQLTKLFEYELGVICASNLPKLDGIFGSHSAPDAFVIAKYQGKEIGRTNHITKSTDPKWVDQYFKLTVDANVASMTPQELSFEVWTHSLVSKSECLGCVVVQKEIFEQLVLQNEDYISQEFDLQPLVLKGIEVNDKSHTAKPTQGKLTLSIYRLLEENEVTADGPKIQITWSEERDTDAGNPTLELSIIKAENLIIAKSILATTDPYCIVKWNEVEIGMTSVSKGINPIWNNEKFSMKLDPTVESDDGSLVLELWDYETLRKGAFLGRVVIPFWSVIRLSDGLFTFSLECSAKGQLVRGSITVSFRIYFPFWDSINPHIPLISRRKVQVLSGNEFPKITGEFPNTKCILSYNGAIKAKTIVVENECNPVWSITQCEILVDANVPTDMLLEVYHVDNVEQKEICIGEVAIPFEYLLRPPNESFDVFLGPPTKPPPRKYKYAVSGSVHIQVINTQLLRADEHQCFSAATERHLASFAVDDCLANKKFVPGTEDALLDGARLTEDQLLWLGSAYDLTRTQVLHPQQQWIIVPIRDLGIRSGKRFNDFYGTKPGHRFALVVQRPRDKINISDAYLLADIEEAIQQCILELRRKQVYQDLRAHTLAKYTHAINEIMKRDAFNNDTIYAWVVKIVKMCFPGCTLTMSILSKDQTTLNVKVFESVSENSKNHYFNYQNPSVEFSMLRGQGFDWELVGRHPPKSLIIKSINDICVSNSNLGKVYHRRLCSLKPFPNSHLPKIYVPFLAGDVANSYFCIDNFDMYKGGQNKAFSDEEAVKSWLEDLGSLFGDAMYVGKEKQSLKLIEKYTQMWDSTIPGLLQQILSQSLNVLQACRLIEMWSMSSQTRNLKSLVGKVADLPVHSGRLLIIKQVSMKPGKSIASNEESNRLVTFNDDAVSEDNDSITVDTNNNTFSSLHNRWLCGIRYDGFEECQIVEDTVHNKKEVKDKSSVTSSASLPDPHNLAFVTEEVKVRITNDRNIIVSLYEVDRQLSIVNEYSGRVSFQSLQETSLRTVLTTSNKESYIQTFDAELSLLWPRPEVALPKVDMKALANKVRTITVKVKRASGLMTLPNAKTSPNSYCEVYFGKKLVGKTVVVKDNSSPEWNQSFTVQYKKVPLDVAIEVYDFTMVGKGAFFGRAEIAFEQLLSPSLGETDFPLAHKIGIKASKQKYIGGLLTLEHSVEFIPVNDEASNKPGTAANPNSTNPAVPSAISAAPNNAMIPRSLFSMENPALFLTITCASDLPKANMFGGGSDPYVLIFSSVSKDPLFRTKVIENNLDPIWNETFAINFGMTLKLDSTSLRDFPDITLEVWDYNRTNKGSFLGCVTITPLKYLTKKSSDFQLVKSPHKTDKENKLVSGISTISVRMKIGDNISDMHSHSKYIANPYTKCLNTLVYVDVYILRCKDLMITNRYTGKSSPFVKVIWNDRIFETAYVKNNLNPVWNNEKFSINITSIASLREELIIQVWEKNFFADGVFMGEVRVPVEQVLHPKLFNQEMQLKSRRHQDDDHELIKGSIIFKLVQKYHTQRLEVKPTEFSCKPYLFPQLEPMDMEFVNDPEEEKKRQLAEKSKFPNLLQKAKELTAKYLNNPFERSKLITELHYGQVVAAVNRTEHTVLRTDKADVCCVPTEFSATNGDSMIIVAKYESNRLPRRDIQFLRKASELLNAGVQITDHRFSRAEVRVRLIQKLRDLQEHMKDSPEEFCLDSLTLLESHLYCPSELFLIGSDGKNLFRCDRITGKLDTNHAAHDFIKLAACLCRHGLLLQYYRGALHIIDFKWDSLSQMCATKLEDVAKEIELVEDQGICQLISQLTVTYAPDGCYVMPVFADQEQCPGILVCHEVNKIPSALYSVISKSSGELDEKDPRNHRSHSKDKNKKGAVEVPMIEFSAPEHGVVDCFRTASSIIGAGIVHCRLEKAISEMHGFHVGPETPLLDIVRFWFRQLATALPSVREVSIWGIDLFQDPNELMAQQSNSQQLARLSAKKNKGGFLTSNPFFGLVMSLFRRNPKKTREISEAVHSLQSYNSTDGKPSIVAGYFADEDPSELLATPIERKKIGSSKGAEKEDRYRRNAIQAARIHKHIIQHAIEQVETMKKDWTVQTPSVFSSPAPPLIPLQSVNEDSEPITGVGVDNASFIGGSSVGLSGSGATSQYNVFGEYSQNETGGKYNRSYVELVRKEVIRCTEELKKSTFRVASGHFLCSIANDDSSKAALDDIFDPDYAKRKAEFERDKQLMLLKKYELEGKRRQRLREKRKKALQQQVLQQQSQQQSQRAQLASQSLQEFQKLRLKTSVDEDANNLSDISDEDEDDDLDDELLSQEDSLTNDDPHHSLMKSISFRSPHHHSLKLMKSPQFSQQFASGKSPGSRNVGFGTSFKDSNRRGSSMSLKAIPGTANASFRANPMKNNFMSSGTNLTAATSNKGSTALAGPLINNNQRKAFFQAPLPPNQPPLPEGSPPTDGMGQLPSPSPSGSLAGTIQSQKSALSSKVSFEDVSSPSANPVARIGSVIVDDGNHSVVSTSSPLDIRKSVRFGSSSANLETNSLDNSNSNTGPGGDMDASIVDSSSIASVISSKTLGIDDPAHRGLGWKYFISIYHHGFGKETGWGVSGPMLNKFLEDMSLNLDKALQMFVYIRHEQRISQENDESIASLERKVIREKAAQAKELAKIGKILNDPDSESSSDGETPAPALGEIESVIAEAEELKHRHSHHHHHHHRHTHRQTHAERHSTITAKQKEGSA